MYKYPFSTGDTARIIRDIYIKGETCFRGFNSAIFLFHKSIVKNPENIFLKFSSKIRSPSDSVRT